MNILQVSNDIKGIEEKRIGLLNIQQRIQIKFGKAYGLSLEENHPRGTIVRLVMPIIQSNNREGLD
jgi:two-component system sensor histidine kinase YesM